jgi:hypothetical protein
MNVLLNRINAKEMFNIQRMQNQECIYMADSIPANSQKLQSLNISTLGHFFCQHITCTFTTVALLGGVPTDTGIDYLSGKLIDGATSRALFNDYVPFSLWCVPGRRKSIAGVGAGSDSFQMQIVFPFEYLFTINGDIVLDVKNVSDQANNYSIAFWGVRVKATQAGN